jgi:hypothetical protein
MIKNKIMNSNNYPCMGLFNWKTSTGQDVVITTIYGDRVKIYFDDVYILERYVSVEDESVDINKPIVCDILVKDKMTGDIYRYRMGPNLDTL